MNKFSLPARVIWKSSSKVSHDAESNSKRLLLLLAALQATFISLQGM